MGNAISSLRVLAGAAVFALRLGKLHKLADEQIQLAVIVIVKPDRAGGPSRRAHSSFFGDVSKSAVTVIVVKNVPAVLGDVNTLETVAVIVPNRHALAVSATANSCLGGHVGECPVSIIAIQSIAKRRIGIEEIAFAAVDQINVHPAIIVAVEEGAAGPGGLRQIMLSRFSRSVNPGDAARGCWNLDERIKRNFRR